MNEEVTELKFSFLVSLLLPDGDDVVKSLAQSKLSTNLVLKERLDFLQRAEAKYYETKTSDDQVYSLFPHICPLY